MTEYKICKVCNTEFRVNRRGGVKCNACVLRQRAENYDTPLKDLTTGSYTYNQDIEGAKELLGILGYDIQGDVHQQWLDRIKEKYGVIF